MSDQNQKNNQSKSKGKFIALLGKIKEHKSWGKNNKTVYREVGRFIRLVSVRKIREKPEKNQGILTLGDSLIQLTTKQEPTEDLLPDTCSRIRRASLTAKIPEDKEMTDEFLKLLVREWISHYIVEDNLEFIGTVEVSFNESSQPKTIRFNTENRNGKRR